MAGTNLSTIISLSAFRGGSTISSSILLAFEEATASNLVKVNIEGRFIGDSKYRINAAGFTIYSAIHGARPEVGCAIQLPTEAGMTLSVLEDGLLPLTQTAMLFQNEPHFTITRVSRSISQRVSALFATLATNPS